MMLGFRAKSAAVEATPLSDEESPAAVPADTRVYAVGDIHGRADLLTALHRKIADDAATHGAGRNVVVYLGDYIDRGPDSRRVVEILLDDPLATFESVHLMGNHEAFLLGFLEDPGQGTGWLVNGGVETLASYGVEAPDDIVGAESLTDLRARAVAALPAAHLDFFESLALTHEEGDYFFVHAGIRPDIALEAQDPDDLLWIREDFLDSSADHGRTIVHGHTISWEPEFRDNRIGIDTGAFASDVLTALVLSGSARALLQS